MKLTMTAQAPLRKNSSIATMPDPVQLISRVVHGNSQSPTFIAVPDPPLAPPKRGTNNPVSPPLEGQGVGSGVLVAGVMELPP